MCSHSRETSRHPLEAPRPEGSLVAPGPGAPPEAPPGYPQGYLLGYLRGHLPGTPPGPPRRPGAPRSYLRGSPGWTPHPPAETDPPEPYRPGTGAPGGSRGVGEPRGSPRYGWPSARRSLRFSAHHFSSAVIPKIVGRGCSTGPLSPLAATRSVAMDANVWHVPQLKGFCKCQS